MSEMVRIANELERVAHGGAWHGPAIHEALDGVSADEARARPIAAAHSIWEIVLHMTAWASEIERRLWQNARPLTGEADWPQVSGENETAWSGAKSALTDAHRRLRQAIREFPPSRLDEPVKGTEDDGQGSSFYVTLHGLAQYDAYHTGQIAILRRAVANGGGTG